MSQTRYPPWDEKAGLRVCRESAWPGDPCEEGHNWAPDPRGNEEGLMCQVCGVTEAEEEARS